MGAFEPSRAEVGHSLAVFSNYRVLRSQQLTDQKGGFPHPSILMSLGLRESGLTNICGGAKMENGVWVRTFTDRGCFQIAEENAQKWLESVPGCPEGWWGPKAGHNAFEQHFCPRFTDAAEYTIQEFHDHRDQALKIGVAKGDVELFCVAAHNAGFGGALDGYRKGDVDLNTAHGDYSKWVKKYSGYVHDWILAHPHWVYDGQPLSQGD